jgi:elongation factor Ts
MAISATQVKELRDKTGAGFMDCKSALAEVDGDIDKAVTILRTRGQARAAKRSGRSTSQGLVASYIHMGGQVGVLVEVGCESDFVARTDEFQQLVREIAMHIAAANPLYATREAVPAEDLRRSSTRSSKAR